MVIVLKLHAADLSCWPFGRSAYYAAVPIGHVMGFALK